MVKSRFAITIAIIAMIALTCFCFYRPRKLQSLLPININQAAVQKIGISRWPAKMGDSGTNSYVNEQAEAVEIVSLLSSLQVGRDLGLLKKKDLPVDISDGDLITIFIFCENDVSTSIVIHEQVNGVFIIPDDGTRFFVYDIFAYKEIVGLIDEYLQ